MKFKYIIREGASLKTDGPHYPIINDLKNPAEIRASTFRLKRQLGEPWYYQEAFKRQNNGRIEKLTKGTNSEKRSGLTDSFVESE